MLQLTKPYAWGTSLLQHTIRSQAIVISQVGQLVREEKLKVDAQFLIREPTGKTKEEIREA